AEVEEPVDEDEPVVERSEEIEHEEPAAAAVSKAAPGFSKLLDSLAGLTGFYGSQPVKVEPVMDDEPAGEETEEQTGEEPVIEEPVGQSELDEPVAEPAEPVEDEL